MKYDRRDQEAAEPLYSERHEENEKAGYERAEAENEMLRAAVRSLRRWLLLVSVVLLVMGLYTIFSAVRTMRGRSPTPTHHAFAPSSIAHPVSPP
jgi:predicted lysophospholipase L1 biosynthesis ABC-type transport system permease subunit